MIKQAPNLHIAGPGWREFTTDWWILLTNGQWCQAEPHTYPSKKYQYFLPNFRVQTWLKKNCENFRNLAWSLRNRPHFLDYISEILGMIERFARVISISLNHGLRHSRPFNILYASASWVIPASRGHLKHVYKLEIWDRLNFKYLVKIASFNVLIRYFVWNFKGSLWNSTQNILPMHWKMCSLLKWKFTFNS